MAGDGDDAVEIDGGARTEYVIRQADVEEQVGHDERDRTGRERDPEQREPPPTAELAHELFVFGRDLAQRVAAPFPDAPFKVEASVWRPF